MSGAIQAARAVGFAGLALVAATLPVLVPAGAAQEKEEEDRRWRGLYRVETDELEMRPMLGVLIARGENGRVLVADVLANSPAEDAGIMEGDFIVSVNGHQLSEPLEAEDERNFDPDRSRPEERLRVLVREAPEGETVTLIVERDGERLTIALIPEVLGLIGGWWPGSDEARELWRETVEGWPDMWWGRERFDTLRELNEQFRDPYGAYRGDPPEWLRQGNIRFYADTISPGQWGLELPWGGNRGRWTHGLDLVELNPGLGDYFGTAEGVLVADIVDDSPLGLRPGDVVVSVDGRVVDDIDELRRILDSYRSDEEIAFRIFRDGAQTTVTGTIN